MSVSNANKFIERAMNLIMYLLILQQSWLHDPKMKITFFVRFTVHLSLISCITKDPEFYLAVCNIQFADTLFETVKEICESWKSR